MKIEELKRFLEIDKSSLDDEIVRQPMLFYDVSEAYVEAAAERDAFKEALATVDADLDRTARLALAKKHGKVTEGMVTAYVQTDRKHEAAFKTYLDAKAAADKLTALKDAFQQRNYMLRDLCSLYVANYFETSSVQGTSTSDAATYKHRRKRLADARVERRKEQ